MWICFNDSFISAVQDRNDPDNLCVRARNRDHLAVLFPNEEIVEMPGTDYACRVFVNKAVLAELLIRRITEIDYTNFKASVADSRLGDLYAGFWEDHRGYQEEIQRERRRHFSWGPGDVEHH